MAEPDGGNKQFLWGAATAAYQIEGSPLADGSGRCVWHEFSHTPGCTDNGDTGDVAADHYNRWRDDIEIMKRLELDAYRFSIRWPRILPDGRGKVNQAGLDFYNRLVDGLVEAGIQPFVTLFHWDLPSALM
ncbi:MAG TPA: family 1 glycosylhydrolase, partial [Acidimicrobiales bacterium]|nr:family 1 glycosylhydrolase [Acidimicrobiales bacterium]